MTGCEPDELEACKTGTSCACLRRDFKRRAREAVDQARRKTAWTPDRLPEPRRIQEPEQEQPTNA